MAPTPMPSMTGGAGGSAGPSSAGLNSGFDSSGWNVNFGGGTIESSKGLDFGQYMPLIAIAVAGVVLWKIINR